MIFVSFVATEDAVSARDIHKATDLCIESLNSPSPRLGRESCCYRIEKITLPIGGDPRKYFETISRLLMRWLEEDRITCIASNISCAELDPLMPNGAYGESLLAMLILAFPEIRWLFSVIEEAGKVKEDKSSDFDKELDEFHRTHGIQNLFQPSYSSLFDGGGLRDWVRRQVKKDADNKKDASYLPRRQQLLVAMDEETEYACLHAYAAYRFGFRGLNVTRRDLADGVFGNDAGKDIGVDAPKVVMEDLYLNFPGDSGGLSDLYKRDRKLGKLNSTKYRIVVTSGQRVPGQESVRKNNRAYFRDQKSKGKKIWKLHKPHAGIFALWKKSRLAHIRFDSSDGPCRSATGWGKGYCWPPDWKRLARETSSSQSSGHSSPGILLQIARSLLNRAEKLLPDVCSVEDAVRGAVLATDALELLGGKTPTMAAEALALKHQFELLAECQFSGVKYHIDMKMRLDEIERDAESIAQWFHHSEQKSAVLNIRMDVINKLVRILREYNQFDEEKVCMARVRRLHNSLYMRERWWRKLAWPFLRYSEFLLTSFWRFTSAIVVWVLAVWWLYYEAGSGLGGDESKSLSSFGHAIGTFFSVDPVPEYLFLSSIVVVAGVFHLGIFISLLYDLVNKK